MNKPYVYAPIPEFDQETQYVAQMAPIDMGDHYFVGIEVHGVVPDEIGDPFMGPTA